MSKVKNILFIMCDQLRADIYLAQDIPDLKPPTQMHQLNAVFSFPEPIASRPFAEDHG